MATWKSKRKFHFDEGQDGLQPGEVGWSFQNTSDFFTFTFEYEEQTGWCGTLPARRAAECYGISRAMAMYEALQDFRDTYYGKDECYKNLEAENAKLREQVKLMREVVTAAERILDLTPTDTLAAFWNIQGLIRAKLYGYHAKVQELDNA